MHIKFKFNNESVSEIIGVETIISNKLVEDVQKMLAIVDSNAFWYYEKSISSKINIPYFIFDNPDEKKKDFRTIEKIHNFLFREKADRKSILLAVGGGVTLDTAGFAASIFKRGINWIAIPTTALAQVDASVGGKTAINNHTYGKNVIGSFHPPIKVFIDPSCSQSWNDGLRLEGTAEMYKIFKIFDHKSLEKLLKGSQVDSLIKRSIELKVKVVEIDPYEMNLRAILNYGHTFGHALESLLNNEENYRKLPHGIAVSIGMRIENYIALTLGIMTYEEFRKAENELNSLGFTKDIEFPEFEFLLDYMIQDKKAETGEINLCFIDGKNEYSFKPVDPRVSVNIISLKKGYKKYIKEFRND